MPAQSNAGQCGHNRHFIVACNTSLYMYLQQQNLTAVPHFVCIIPLNSQLNPTACTVAQTAQKHAEACEEVGAHAEAVATYKAILGHDVMAAGLPKLQMQARMASGLVHMGEAKSVS